MHACVSSIPKFVCLCAVSGNYSCGPSECDQICVNITSELSCSCFPGFELEPNELNCTGKLHTTY